jgi:hypothetical protein
MQTTAGRCRRIPDGLAPDFPVFRRTITTVSLRLTAFGLAAALLGAAMADSAFADRGKSGHRGSAAHSGHARSSSAPHHFHHHHHHHGRFRGPAFVTSIVAPAYYYPAPYPAPYYALPPGYWYYCPAYGAYYPYVTDCPSGWQPVAPGGY